MHFDVVSGSPGKKYLLGGVSHPHGMLLRLVGLMGRYTKRYANSPTSSGWKFTNKRSNCGPVVYIFMEEPENFALCMGGSI